MQLAATTDLDADETTSVLEIKNTNMNGNGNAKNGASNPANDVKYPANCAMRLGSSPGGAEGLFTIFFIEKGGCSCLFTELFCLIMGHLPSGSI